MLFPGHNCIYSQKESETADRLKNRTKTSMERYRVAVRMYRPQVPPDRHNHTDQVTFFSHFENTKKKTCFISGTKCESFLINIKF